MSWNDRVKLYHDIEAHRKRPLIVYVTSKRAGATSLMATDALPSLIEQLDSLPLKTRDLDLMIASLGGDPMVAWRIMSLIRQRALDVSVLIPQSAYSAATLLALGANQIVMHPNGHLGPVDMQITSSGDSGQKRFSTEDISAFLDFVRDNLKITDQEHVRALFEITCKEVGSLGIGFTARSSKLAVDLGERLLAMHMKDDDSGLKLRSIVQNMSRKFQSHAYPVSRTEALELGLPVNKKRDEELEKLMWNAWVNIEADLAENSPFDPVLELVNSAEGAKLLRQVPQMDLPAPASLTPHYSTSLDDVAKHTTLNIEPVDFQYIGAIVESSRLASAHITRGKILACRMPDLMINWNLVTTSKIWEKSKGMSPAQGSTP
jgi:hypothetical protein